MEISNFNQHIITLASKLPLLPSRQPPPSTVSTKLSLLKLRLYWLDENDLQRPNLKSQISKRLQVTAEQI